LSGARGCYRAFVAVCAAVLIDLEEQRTVALFAAFYADTASGAFLGVYCVFIAVFDNVLADKCVCGAELELDAGVAFGAAGSGLVVSEAEVASPAFGVLVSALDG
jgi:hypothetical protein